MFFKKLFPFSLQKEESENSSKYKLVAEKDIFNLWGKVIVACLPAAVIGILFDDFLEEHLHTPLIISLALILYGVAFIWVENRNKTRELPLKETAQIGYKQALLIGAFQVLSLIPGTSRSGATILGALLIGVARPAGAEFTFFLAIPVMFGVSFLKIVTNDLVLNPERWLLLVIAMVVAYIVSLISVKFLTNYVRRHDFKFFGWYRIVLGLAVIAYFFIF
jgi:undecaprenyl-diphosphatase